MNKYTISKAKIKDSRAIVRVIKSVYIENLKSKKNGFLMSNRGEKYYRLLIEMSKYCYTIRRGKTIVGFMIAYPGSLPNTGYDIKEYLPKKYSKTKFIYIFQVAISPAHQRKNLGTRIYRRLFKDTIGIKKVVNTSAKPYNQASEKFHLGLGFKKIKKHRAKNGGLLYLYIK